MEKLSPMAVSGDARELVWQARVLAWRVGGRKDQQLLIKEAKVARLENGVGELGRGLAPGGCVMSLERREQAWAKLAGAG